MEKLSAPSTSPTTIVDATSDFLHILSCRALSIETTELNMKFLDRTKEEKLKITVTYEELKNTRLSPDQLRDNSARVASLLDRRIKITLYISDADRNNDFAYKGYRGNAYGKGLQLIDLELEKNKFLALYQKQKQDPNEKDDYQLLLYLERKKSKEHPSKEEELKFNFSVEEILNYKVSPHHLTAIFQQYEYPVTITGSKEDRTKLLKLPLLPGWQQAFQSGIQWIDRN